MKPKNFAKADVFAEHYTPEHVDLMEAVIDEAREWAGDCEAIRTRSEGFAGCDVCPMGDAPCTMRRLLTALDAYRSKRGIF